MIRLAIEVAAVLFLGWACLIAGMFLLGALASLVPKKHPQKTCLNKDKFPNHDQRNCTICGAA